MHQTLAGYQNIISLRKIRDLSKKFLLRKIHSHIQLFENVSDYVIFMIYYMLLSDKWRFNCMFSIFHNFWSEHQMLARSHKYSACK